MKVQEINVKNERGNKKNKNNKKKGKNLFLLEFIFVSGMLIATLILLALSPLLTIKTISVNGSKHYKAGDLITASKLQTGMNGFKMMGSSIEDILLLRFGTAEATIEKGRPYIKNAVVKYALPDKIMINIEERTPLGVIPLYGNYILLDSDACVLEILNEEKSRALPHIKGLKFDNYKVGQALEVKNKDNFLYAVKLINEINKSDKNSDFKLLASIDYFDVKDIDNICLSYDSRIIVNLGNLEQLSYRIDFMKQILQQNIKKDEKGRIDFTLGEEPSFIPEDD